MGQGGLRRVPEGVRDAGRGECMGLWEVQRGLGGKVVCVCVWGASSQPKHRD